MAVDTKTLNKLIDIIRNAMPECENDVIIVDTNIYDDLRADSLDIVEIIMAIEEEFGIWTDDKEVEKVRTVGDLIRLINEKKNGGED